MSRFISRTSQTLIDLLVLSVAFWLAFFLRFEGDLPELYFKRLMFAWPYVVLFQYGVLWMLGVRRISWRYVSLRDAARILAASTVFTLALLGARFAGTAIRPLYGHALYLAVPIGVILIDYVLVVLGVAGVRAMRRLSVERRARDQRALPSRPEVATMLIGAGEAGVMVAQELRRRPDLGIHPVGFLDDDPNKVGLSVQGLRVLGPTARLDELCNSHDATQALITIANAPGEQIRRIKALCDEAEIPAKIIPGIYEIVGGKVNLSRIRPVAIEDLLGREPIHLDERALSAFISRKVVLVTGAGGSIGSEVCRQVARFGPSKLVLVERFENALFEIHRELTQRNPDLALLPLLADVTDGGRMERIFSEARPDVVFHAAAHKHVPMMELNPGEAIKNNVLGTRAVAELAARFEVGHFVMISTDKAVNPTSVMGASKRVAELLVQGMAGHHRKTTFVSVRFGNVLGSSGSVIPIFKAQIAAGGPVTVTHPDMKRYFMTIPEATQLVLQAATLGEGGEVFILDMGEPVKIADLARDLIRLSGFEPERDIEIKYTGVRPGEKLFEELAFDAEQADKTRHDKIFVGRVEPADWRALCAGIDAISEDIDHLDERAIYEGLRELIPEFSGHAEASEAQVIHLASGDSDA